MTLMVRLLSAVPDETTPGSLATGQHIDGLRRACHYPSPPGCHLPNSTALGLPQAAPSREFVARNTELEKSTAQGAGDARFPTPTNLGTASAPWRALLPGVMPSGR